MKTKIIPAIILTLTAVAAVIAWLAHRSHTTCARS